MNEPVATPIEITSENESIELKIKTPEGIEAGGFDIFEYEKSNGRPFVADFFKVGELYSKSDSTREKVDHISSYFNEITNGEPIISVIEELLNDYQKEIGIKQDDSEMSKLNKVHELIRIKRQIELLDKLKEKALADINKLV